MNEKLKEGLVDLAQELGLGLAAWAMSVAILSVIIYSALGLMYFIIKPS